MRLSALACAAFASVAIPAAVWAQVDAPPEKPAPAKTPSEQGTPQAEPADPNTGGLTLTGGVDYVTSYFFRGYNQEDTGLIFQPYVTITATLVSNDNFTLNGYVGTWNSFH